MRRGFTHGPLITAKCPLRVRMRPDHEHGNGMGRVDMERGPDSVQEVDRSGSRGTDGDKESWATTKILSRW